MTEAASRESLLKQIRGLGPPDFQTLLIAIDGYGGSGKSTLARSLAGELEADVVCSDDFARPKEPGWEWSRFRKQVLEPLLNNEVARYQRYDWDEDQLAEWHEIEPGGVLIVEGVSATRSELGDPWDLKVWVECPADIRLARGIERDGEAMRDKWLEWTKQEEAYVGAQRPEQRADVVILGYSEPA